MPYPLPIVNTYMIQRTPSSEIEGPIAESQIVSWIVEGTLRLDAVEIVGIYEPDGSFDGNRVPLMSVKVFRRAAGGDNA